MSTLTARLGRMHCSCLAVLLHTHMQTLVMPVPCVSDVQLIFCTRICTSYANACDANAFAFLGSLGILSECV